VYAGHAAIALMVKGRRPRIPIGVLVPVAFGPDWIAWVLDLLGRRNEIISHSLVSVAVASAVCGFAYFVATRSRADALAIAATYASHWPVDFITGLKPTWPGGPEVGLLLYEHRVADFLLESVVVVMCWLAYRSVLSPSRRRAGLLIPAGLIALQAGFTLIQLPAIKDPLKERLTAESIMFHPRVR